MKPFAAIFVFSVYLIFTLSSAHAVQFGSDSAKITNPYIPLDIGSWRFSKGVGTNWRTRIFYIHAIGTELVSGAKIGSQVFNNAKTLKTNIAITDDGGSNEHEVFTFYFAQDTAGNVWILKIHSHMENVTGLLGGQYHKSMFMPALPAVGLPAGVTLPEDDQNFCRIVRVGINGLATTYGVYDDCIEVNCYEEDPTDTTIEYFCRGTGIVRDYDEANPSDVMDLKEFGQAIDQKVVVIPLPD